MNYIAIINSFWDSATTNPLSTGQVSLYFALLHICNRSNWTEWFAAPNQVAFGTDRTFEVRNTEGEKRIEAERAD